MTARSLHFRKRLVRLPDTALLGADMIEQLEHVMELLGYFQGVSFLENPGLGKRQSARAGSSRQDFETIQAEHGDAQQSVGAMFPVIYRDPGADRVDVCIDGGFFALVNQHDSENAVFAHAVGNHVEVARLENFQPQRVARQQHGL
jgi:hypothetical protein